MATQLQRLYYFGEFRLDPWKRTLLRGNEVVALTPKAFEILKALVERHGEVVDKETLFKQVWPDSFVEDGNITYNVWILRRALGEKKTDHNYIVTLPSRGYQFVADVRVEERASGPEEVRVVEEEESEAEISVVAAPEQQPEPEGQAAPAAPEAKPAAAVGASSRRRWIWPVIIGVMVVVAVAVYWLLAKSRPQADRGPFAASDVSRVTSTGRAFDAAISPNGERIAYVLEDAKGMSLWVKELAANREFEVVASADGRYRGVSFSRDGKQLYYVARFGSETERSLYVVPAAGGTARNLLTGIDSLAAFSPDGRQFAFVVEDQTARRSSLFVASADGTGRRVVAERKWPAFFSVDGPSWSPDGKLIACAAVDGPGVDYRAITVDVATGAETPVGNTDWDWMKRVAWLPDGSGLLMLARERDPEKSSQLWHLSYPDGEARRISSDLSEYRGLSLSADGRKVVLVATQIQSDIWIVPVNDPRSAAPITTSGAQQNGFNGLDWTPDGRIIYTSRAIRESDLWMIDSRGGSAQRLNVPEGVPHYPSVSADGRYVVFTSGRNGTPRIWRLETATGELRELTGGELDLHPDCSSDGQWVYYSAIRSGLRTIWRVPFAGGEAMPLTDKHSEQPVVSPDGRQVAFMYQEELTQTPQAVLMPVEGGTLKVLDSMPQPNTWPQMAWAPDGKSLSYVRTSKNVSNIYRRPFAGGPDVQVTDFRDRRIFAYAWSRDGRNLALARGASHGDVVMFAEP